MRGGGRTAEPAAPMLCGGPEEEVEEEDGGAEEGGVEEDGAEGEVVSVAPFADPISADSGQSCHLLARAWRTETDGYDLKPISKFAGNSGHHLPIVKIYCGVVRPTDGTRR